MLFHSLKVANFILQFANTKKLKNALDLFSSPFIEERLYFKELYRSMKVEEQVLVPFYRGAVVFDMKQLLVSMNIMFSSPFIEERLYLMN